MDPYDVLNLPPRSATAAACTIEQARYNYKVLARQLHPDKRAPGVTNEDATYMFQVLTDAYKQVVSDIERARVDRTHHELRSDSASASGTGNGAGTLAHPEGDSKFNISKFNKVFDDIRQQPAEDSGYTEWMNKNPATLQQAQEEERARIAKQTTIQRYRDPEPTPLPGRASSIPFTELGQTRNADFGKGHGGAQTFFSDYRIAHTTTRLADERAMQAAEAQRVSYEALKAARETATFEMTEEDQHMERLRNKERERLEMRRQRALKIQDKQMVDQYDRASRLLLN